MSTISTLANGGGPLDAAITDMPIVAVETVRTTIQPNVTIVMVHTDAGLVGLGETFYGASSVEAHIHDVAAPLIAGIGSWTPTAVAGALPGYVGYSGSGVEARAASAIDIALWDLLGKRAGLPLRDVLGGSARSRIPIYNTCAGSNYINQQSRQSSANWGMPADGDVRGDHEDLWAFLHEPARLARELVDAGFRGMKVWPFDLAAEISRGDDTTDLRDGLRVLDAIRSEVGDDIDLYVELHSLWNLAGARRLFRHLEPFGLTWAEDPIRPDHVQALAALASETNVPIAAGESLGAGHNQYKPLLDTRSLDVAVIDAGWSGGVTNGLKIAALAEQYGVPVALHDCTGPISLATSVHMVTAVSNCFVQEVARAFYYGWYQEMATGVPLIADGTITPSAAPGHGVSLTEDFLSHAGTSRRMTRF